MANPGKVRIGVSGWVYPPWRGVFYPPQLPHAQELAHIGRTFSTSEVNSTFYRTQTPDSFARWRGAVPKEFVFALKGSRYITHILRLKEARPALANFFASGLLRLGPKLGPILWQLPPSFRFDAKRIDDFLTLLPRDTMAAARLARRHDKRVAKPWTRADKKRRLRHALEIRHDSLAEPAFIELLRRHNVALVCADTEKWPQLMDLTADFIYCRLHGSDKLYYSNYDAKGLNLWARRTVAWAHGEDPPGRHVLRKAPRRRVRRDVFVYFDNTEKVYAPENALQLAARVAARLKPR